LNPVEGELVKRPEDWEYSSYRDYIGVRNGKLPKSDIVLSQFDNQEDYRKFVEAYQSRDKKYIENLLFD